MNDAASVSGSVLSSGRLPGRGVWFRAVLAAVCIGVGLGFYVWVRPLQVLFALAQVTLRLQGVHSEYVQVDGYRIHYYVGGSGKPIVLVHGLGGRSEDWTMLIPRLLQGGTVFMRWTFWDTGGRSGLAMRRFRFRRRRGSSSTSWLRKA